VLSGGCRHRGSGLRSSIQSTSTSHVAPTWVKFGVEVRQKVNSWAPPHHVLCIKAVAGLAGWCPTVFSWIQQRRKSRGVHQTADSIDCQRIHCRSEMTLWNQSGSQLSPRSRYPSGCWPYHANSLHKNYRQLLCSCPPDQQHSPLSWSVGTSIRRLFFGAVTVGLRVCHSGWAASASSVTWQAPVGAQCCCTADIREPSASAQPRDTPSPQSSLATPTGARADNLPVSSTRLPLPSRLRTCLPCFWAISGLKSQSTTAATIVVNNGPRPSHPARQPCHPGKSRICGFSHVGLEQHIAWHPYVTVSDHFQIATKADQFIVHKDS